MVFNSKDLLKSHLRDVVNRCQVQPEQVFDGITPETEKLLRSRKKEYRDQSESELWKRMYWILFPDEFVPSPCKLEIFNLPSLCTTASADQKDYEAIRDENADPPDVRERANYHEYVRRELPRLIRSRLESAINLQFQTLASALDEIIQGCMDQLLMNYETARATNADSNRDALRPSIAIPTTSTSQRLRARLEA
jgi:hypothetical protein